MAFDVGTFLDQVYGLDGTDKQEATFKVFDNIDRLCCDGKFDVVDDILDRVEIGRLSSSLIRSLVVITWAAKDSLERRSEFYGKAYSALSAMRGKSIADRLIGHLL